MQATEKAWNEVLQDHAGPPAAMKKLFPKIDNGRKEATEYA
jgi:hypothetical protein